MGQVSWRKELKRRLGGERWKQEGGAKVAAMCSEHSGEDSLRDCPGKSGEPGCAPAKKPIDLAMQRGTDGVFAGELL